MTGENKRNTILTMNYKTSDLRAHTLQKPAQSMGSLK